MINQQSKLAMQLPMFDPIRESICKLLKNGAALPSISEYNYFLQQSAKKITSASHMTLQAIGQHKDQLVTDNYEASIYLRGELRTRENSWHDFFNLLMWYTFPSTKAVINKWQYHHLTTRPRKSTRTHAENLLTQFDEGGLIILSSNKLLTQQIIQQQWLNLFWNNRCALHSHMQFYLIGHAMYERLLNPIAGITAPALIIEVEASVLMQPISQKITTIDSLCANYLDNDHWYDGLAKLLSVPILGIPGWYHENNCENFYHNKNYFWSKESS